MAGEAPIENVTPLLNTCAHEVSTVCKHEQSLLPDSVQLAHPTRSGVGSRLICGYSIASAPTHVLQQLASNLTIPRVF